MILKGFLYVNDFFSAVMGCWEIEQTLQSLTCALFSLLPFFINSESFLKFGICSYTLLAFILPIIAALLSDDKVVFDINCRGYLFSN
jgi:hypothetical protein